VHVDNKQKRGLAALSFATILHDVTWEGVTSSGEAIPEKWKLFPGVLYPPFRDKFFGASSTGSDACEWVRHEYRQDQLVWHFGSQPMLQSHFDDAFWSKDVFEHLRDGRWGSYQHPANEADISQNFSVFAFILSVVPRSSWPPKLPADSLSSEQMSQLGKNLMCGSSTSPQHRSTLEAVRHLFFWDTRYWDRHCSTSLGSSLSPACGPSGMRPAPPGCRTPSHSLATRTSF
jgi:hypothetical protein